MKFISKWFLVLNLMLLVTTPALGVAGDILQKFTLDKFRYRDNFGSAISFNDQSIIISAHNGNSGGSVFLYDRDTFLLATEIKNTGTSTSQFGWSIAGYGNELVIGARSDDTYGQNSGRAYRYNNDGELLDSYISSTPTPLDYFGQSVGYNGNSILVGDNSNSASGTMHHFDLATGNHINVLNNPSSSSSDLYGSRQTFSNGNVVVSAMGDDSGGVNSGVVYVHDGISNTVTQTILNPSPANQAFGYSLDAHDNKLLVGAPDRGFGSVIDSTGEVTVFDTITGENLLTINDPDAAVGNFFGSAVNWFGNDILVGAPGTDVDGQNNAGAAYLFDGETGDLLNSYFGNGIFANSDVFGSSITSFDDKILISAPGETFFFGCFNTTDEFGNTYEECDYRDVGSVYVFESVSAVPLPTAFWLFLSGLLPLAMRVRYSK